MKAALVLLVALSAAAIACSRSIDLDQAADEPELTNDVHEGDFVFSTLRFPRPLSDAWVDGERVYWADDQLLRSCVYQDCAATLVSYERTRGPLASDSRSIYFAASGGLSGYDYGWTLIRCPKVGCDNERVQFVNDALTVYPVIHDDYLYWISTVDIYRCPLTGCAEIPEVVVRNYSPFGQVNYGASLTAAGGYVYWLAPALGSLDPPEQIQIFRAPVDGSDAATALTPSSSDSGLGSNPSFTVQGDMLYWLDATARILSCPASGCVEAPQVLLDSVNSKRMLRSDALGLYWLELAGGTTPQGNDVLMFHPYLGTAAGGSVQALTPVGVRSFLLDAQFVYWFTLRDRSDPNSVNPDFVVDSIARTEKPLPQE